MLPKFLINRNRQFGAGEDIEVSQEGRILKKLKNFVDFFEVGQIDFLSSPMTLQRFRFDSICCGANNFFQDFFEKFDQFIAFFGALPPQKKIYLCF